MMRPFPVARVRIALAVMVSLVALLAMPPAPAFAQSDATERIVAWLSENESLRASFRQVIFDEEGLLIGESNGTVAFLRPYRFRWDYASPGPQVIVADGSDVWWYDVELEQVTVRPVDTALEGTPAVLLAGPRGAAEHFLISALSSAEDLDWIQLTPRGGDAVFRAIRVGMHGREIRAVEMDDGFGQTTRIDFFDIEHNPLLDNALFQFEPPPGTDVIRGG